MINVDIKADTTGLVWYLTVTSGTGDFSLICDGELFTDFDEMLGRVKSINYEYEQRMNETTGV